MDLLQSGMEDVRGPSGRRRRTGGLRRVLSLFLVLGLLIRDFSSCTGEFEARARVSEGTWVFAGARVYVRARDGERKGG